jgi:TrkA family protein
MALGLTREGPRSAGRHELGALAIAVLAYVLGVVGLRWALPASESNWDVAYQGLQLFVLGGDVTDHVTGNPPLQIARFLAPFATVLGLLVGVRSVLDEKLRLRRIARATGHTIVCGNGPAAQVLAQSLRADGRTVVLVGDTAPEMDGIASLRGNARELDTLRAAGVAGASTLYACEEHSAASAAVALAAGASRSERAPRLATFAQVRSDGLVEALRVRRMAARRPDTVTIDFFVLHDIAARVLLERHPVGRTTPVVVGFDDVGRAVLRAIVRYPGTPPHPRTVVVAGAEPETVDVEAARIAAERRGWDVQHGPEDAGDGPIYVCLRDEDEAISTGLRLARPGDRDVVVCLPREAPFRQALAAGGRLTVFGVLDEACRRDTIAADSIIGRAARAIHEQYRVQAARRGESPATNPSMLPWAELAPHLRESNIAQAEHIGAKLAEIGASVTTVPPEEPFALTEEEVLRLARLEHVRWMEEREAAGFRYGARRDDKHHPDLVDWSNLSEESQQKDVHAVRHLPELLAAEGLYIQRGHPSALPR